MSDTEQTSYNFNVTNVTILSKPKLPQYTRLVSPIKIENEREVSQPIKSFKVSQVDVNSETNFRLMSISQGLKNQILPKTYEEIKYIQQKRIRKYFDLIGTLGENNKLT